MDPSKSPESLQRKVQFDIRLHFARRGCENMEKMLVNDFQLHFNKKKELWYLVKVRDELTKNHQEIGDVVSGYMPENPTDKLCPIKSYRLYVEHLNTNNKYLWKKPLQNVNMQKQMIWYGLHHIGKNTLGKFMTEVSHNCGLSTPYTNHSIHVTGITVLTRMQFSSSEIMAVSGHKSVQSLTNYQKTKSKQKISMGQALYQSMTRSEEDIQIEGKLALQSVDDGQLAIEYSAHNSNKMNPSENAVVPVLKKQNVTDSIIPFEPTFDNDVPDFDLVSILEEFEKQNTTKEQPPQNQVSVITTTSNTVNIPKAMFSNCTIHNITFNIQK